jgi:predicted phage tail protein
MLTVYLYGWMAEQYGKKHKLAVRSPAEAIRAFSANYPDFRQRVIDGGGYHVLAGKEDRADETGLHLPTSKSIKIIPAVAGKSGLGRILAGAALIGASFFLPATPLISGFAFSAASIASSVGFSLLLGGVSSLLFSPSKVSSGSAERPENRPSYNFNGAINTTGQGGAVPLCYGRLRVGSQLISAGTETANL